MYLLCAFMAACAPNQGSPPGETNDAEARKGKLTSNFSLEELREIAAEADNSEISDVEVNSIQTLNRDFKEANTQTRLFDENLSNDDARFNRLETAVQDIHNELADITPGVNRLIAIEKDIKELHSKLSTLVQGPSATTATPSSSNSTSTPASSSNARRASLTRSTSDTSSQPSDPEPVDPVEEYLPSAEIQTDVTEAEEIIEEKVQQIEAVEQNGGVSMELRAWESADKTRIVFETPEKEDYKLNYDAANATITITTDQKFSEEQLSTIERNSNQIVTTDVQYNNAADQAVLTIEVQNTASISSGYYLPPESDSLTHRYYFDIIK